MRWRAQTSTQVKVPSEHPASNIQIRQTYVSLALISFLVIFLELLVIRWLASEIRIFAYFKNFPLLAAFLGFGIGCLLAGRSGNTFRYSPFLLLVTVSVICLARPLGYTHVVFTDPFELYLIGNWGSLHNPMLQLLKGSALLAGVFILIVLLFVALGEKVGACLRNLPALPAYIVNIAFSLLGGLVFSLLCWVSAGPVVWLTVAVLAMIPLARKTGQILLLTGAIAVALLQISPNLIWSPYYRIDLEPITLRANDGRGYPIGYNINVNYDGIMGAYNHGDSFVGAMPSEVRSKLLDYYNVPYRIFGPRFSRVLILGAGAGNDVATALRNNVAHVDAVEIDPAIVDIGKRLHPERPYASERVQVHIGDARTFVRNQANSGYDLIIFGALDSHTVFSSMSSLRLDNYVYTVESFRDSLQRLAPDGVIAVTFYYYKNWQLERVYNALRQANGSKPTVVYSLYETRNNIVMLAGPGANRMALLNHPYVAANNAEDNVGDGSVEPTTDDWPFLYLKHRGIPLNYAPMLILILGISFLGVRMAQVNVSRVDWVMFLLGLGFMLLETKLLAKIGLLIGNTWTVNTFVISGVLIMIMAATYAVQKGWLQSVPFALVALIVTLIADWALRFNTITLVSNPLTNNIVVLSALFLPVFFAAVVYARLYSKAKEPSTAFGYNLLGAMVGGIMEYTSTAIGINNLNLLCLGAYLGVAIIVSRRVKFDIAPVCPTS